MLLWTIIKVGLKSLLANKMRSILAMLGIIIGVGAVISMLALGSGFQKKMMDAFATMGTNLLMVSPGSRGTGGVMSGIQQNMTLEDAQAILAEVDGVEQVAPTVSKSAQVKYANHNMRSSIIGSAVTYMPVRNFQIDRGRAFSETEVDQRKRVAVLGSSTAEQLFGLNDPLDEMVKINGINFRVVGVTKTKGNQGWFNPDEVVIVPYTTAMKQLFGLTYLQEIDVQAKENADSAKVQADITALLRKRHRLQPNVPEDFSVRNQADWIQMATDQLSMFRWLLGSIAAISLLVGGIGIMNIMLVTVTERTREIGVRKAIGAKERHILTQFLLESMIVSGLGGLLGVVLGVASAAAIAGLSDGKLPSQVEAFGVALSLSFAICVGVVFGFYPAWRASRLNPVDALRYE